LCDNASIDRVKKIFLLSQLGLDIVLLIVGLTSLLHNNISVHRVVENDLFYRTVQFEDTLGE
jgi:hypothetical protein